MVGRGCTGPQQVWLFRVLLVKLTFVFVLYPKNVRQEQGHLQSALRGENAEEILLQIYLSNL